MSEVLKIKKHDKEGKVLFEGKDLELPTEYDELEVLPGREKTLKMVRNQMKIEARAAADPRREHKEREPGLKKVKEAAKEAGISYEDLLEFIKKSRM